MTFLRKLNILQDGDHIDHEYYLYILADALEYTQVL